MAVMSVKIFVTLGILTAVTMPHEASGERSNDPDKSVCEHWALIAQQMTGGGKYQSCVNNRTDACTRLDCSGTITYTHPVFADAGKENIEVDYCFGAELNSCLEPMSMDFYLQVPARNVTYERRVHHDTEVEISALSFPIANLGKVYPVLYFEFERQKDGNIKMSVTAKVKFHTKLGVNMFLSQLDTHLIDEETIHATSCSKLTNDTMDDVTAKISPGECHPGKYVAPVSPSAKKPSHYIPSETLGKSCDIVSKHCDPRELCDLTLTSPVCICKLEYKKSTKGDDCMSTSRYDQACRQHDDCSYWEVCAPDVGKCRCEEGYIYSYKLDTCVKHTPGASTEAPPKNKDEDKPSPVQPSIPTADSHKSGMKVNSTDTDNGAKASSLSKLPPILGGVLGALVLIALAVWGFIYMRRRKRNRLSTLLGGIQDDSSDALLGDTDDMIM